MNKKNKNLLLTILIALITLLLSTGPALAGVTINGAGATFPYPVYAQWAWLYNKDTGVKLNYQSIGSGGGIRQIKADEDVNYLNEGTIVRHTIA